MIPLSVFVDFHCVFDLLIMEPLPDGAEVVPTPGLGNADISGGTGMPLAPTAPALAGHDEAETALPFGMPDFEAPTLSQPSTYVRRLTEVRDMADEMILAAAEPLASDATGEDVWLEHFSAEHDRTYFVNSCTGESKW